MPKTIIDETSGEEVEVYTADEVEAAKTEAVTAKETELNPRIKTLEEELTGAKTALGQRANEFAQFRKLNDEQVAKLTETERQLYENGLVLEQERQKRITAEETTRTATVDGVIKVKSNGNQALADKMKEMWAVIDIDANTPEQIEAKATMVLGALSTTVPDLVAAANAFMGGSYTPPVTKPKEGETFADSPEGKAAAAELGLTLEAPAA